MVDVGVRFRRTAGERGDGVARPRIAGEALILGRRLVAERGVPQLRGFAQAGLLQFHQLVRLEAHRRQRAGSGLQRLQRLRPLLAL